jgi:hypothetical protein
MSKNRLHVIVPLALVLLALLGFVGASLSRDIRAADGRLPTQLSDRDFWRLTDEFSEPNGYFRSDNLLSNEIFFQNVIPDLVNRTKPGGVYIGVGPEQNFTYISAIKPKMAFIPDIRRGNLDLQLVYKALFELSGDRVEFVSRLFNRPRPNSLGPKSTASEIFAAYANVEPVAEATYQQNLKGLEELLVKKHGFQLTPDDVSGLNHVYHNFYMFGPDINYNSSMGGGGFGAFVSYSELMKATDGQNEERSFLASEANFKIVKDLEQKNLIVPLVGDLAGPKALKSVGQYLKDHNGLVVAFYASNVEQFLYGSGTWVNFCRNIAAMPLDVRSTFIRSVRSAGYSRGLMSVLGSMKSETQNCAAAH